MFCFKSQGLFISWWRRWIAAWLPATTPWRHQPYHQNWHPPWHSFKRPPWAATVCKSYLSLVTVVTWYCVHSDIYVPFTSHLYLPANRSKPGRGKCELQLDATYSPLGGASTCVVWLGFWSDPFQWGQGCRWLVAMVGRSGLLVKGVENDSRLKDSRGDRGEEDDVSIWIVFLCVVLCGFFFCQFVSAYTFKASTVAGAPVGTWWQDCWAHFPNLYLWGGMLCWRDMPCWWRLRMWYCNRFPMGFSLWRGCG